MIYLAELGLEGLVNLIEGAAEIGELLAGFLGDHELGHAVPVNLLPNLEGLVSHIHHFLPGAAHFLWLSLKDSAACSENYQVVFSLGWFSYKGVWVWLLSLFGLLV